jgi:DNA invertase Pin-like site-specific DNA recombinase
METNSRVMTTKHVAYYRVSSGGAKRAPLDLDAQREAVRRKLGGVTVLAFTEVETRRKGDRPELARALAACREQGATLVVATMDGLSRDRHFLRALADGNVLVAFCDLPVPDGAGGRFMLQMMARVAEMESDRASERTRAALRAKLERDGPWDRNARHHLVPGAGQAAAAKAVRARADERAAHALALARPMAADGLTLTAMAAALNRRGVPTARQGRWTPTAVKRLLERARRLDGPRLNQAGLD